MKELVEKISQIELRISAQMCSDGVSAHIASRSHVKLWTLPHRAHAKVPRYVLRNPHAK